MERVEIGFGFGGGAERKADCFFEYRVFDARYKNMPNQLRSDGLSNRWHKLKTLKSELKVTCEGYMNQDESPYAGCLISPMSLLDLWLPRVDSNHDTQSQSLVSYR